MTAADPTADGAVALLPWLVAPLRDALDGRRAHHAVLIHGPPGVGQFQLALALAQAWLCERDEPAGSEPDKPCGRCASCRLFAARNHPDLLVLLPEALQESLGWTADDPDAAAATSERKPSKDVRVEDVRRATAFAQLSSARGRAKVVVLFPADRLNAIAANALLKTLEEPPGSARFVLATGAADRLLATVRSRCRPLHLPTPPARAALDWLQAQGVADAEVLLVAAGGQVLDAQAWSSEGVDGAAWLRLPKQVLEGNASGLVGWPLPRVIEALQKLCHDALRRHAGAAPRYFADVPAAADASGLHAWREALARAARHAEHPWNAGLLVESLVLQGRAALAASRPATARSLNSGR